jgi:DNA-binding MarR family transcriptional regulator
VPSAAPGSADDGTRFDVADGLVRLSFLVQGIYARVSERYDLTPVQAKLLCILVGQPRGMAELAGCFGVERAALTGLVDRAERRGLVWRATVANDRRAVRVTLTENGHRAAVGFHAAVSAELDRLAGPLDPKTREVFRGAMAQIVGSTAERAPAELPPGRAAAQVRRGGQARASQCRRSAAVSSVARSSGKNSRALSSMITSVAPGMVSRSQ